MATVEKEKTENVPEEEHDTLETINNINIEHAYYEEPNVSKVAELADSSSNSTILGNSSFDEIDQEQLLAETSSKITEEVITEVFNETEHPELESVPVSVQESEPQTQQEPETELLQEQELTIDQVSERVKSRELKSLLNAAKESNLDTNITHKRERGKSVTSSEDFTGKRKSNKHDDGATVDSDISNLSKTPKRKREKDSLVDSPVDSANTDERRKSKKSLKMELALSPVIKSNKDKYCWRCHRDGVMVHCETCPRSFHIRCLKQPVSNLERWPCPECLAILQAESTKTRSPAMRDMSLEHLCELLKYAVKRMITCTGSEPFIHPVDLKSFPDYRNYIVQPMDLTTLETNIRNNVFGSTVAFMADAKWILHNSIIYNSYQSKLTSAAKSIVKICKQEMTEIETCAECYQNANTKKNSWFVEVCSKPHILLWAKLKGFPYWPAKGMTTNAAGLVDVRFFGAHDRAWIPVKECFLYSKKDPNTTNKTKRNNIAECVKEVDIHIDKLKQRFGEFCYPPYRTPYDPNTENQQLSYMLPRYQGLVKKIKVVPKLENDDGSSVSGKGFTKKIKLYRNDADGKYKVKHHTSSEENDSVKKEIITDADALKLKTRSKTPSLETSSQLSGDNNGGKHSQESPLEFNKFTDGYGTDDENVPLITLNREARKKYVDSTYETDDEKMLIASEDSECEENIANVRNNGEKQRNSRKSNRFIADDSDDNTDLEKQTNSPETMKLKVSNNLPNSKVNLKRLNIDEHNLESPVKLQRRNSDISTKSDSSRISAISDKLCRVEEFTDGMEVMLGNTSKDTPIISFPEKNTPEKQTRATEYMDQVDLIKLKPIIQVSTGDLYNKNNDIKISPQNKTSISIADHLIKKISANDPEPVKKQLNIDSETETPTTSTLPTNCSDKKDVNNGNNSNSNSSECVSSTDKISNEITPNDDNKKHVKNDIIKSSVNSDVNKSDSDKILSVTSSTNDKITITLKENDITTGTNEKKVNDDKTNKINDAVEVKKDNKTTEETSNRNNSNTTTATSSTNTSSSSSNSSSNINDRNIGDKQKIVKDKDKISTRRKSKRKRYDDDDDDDDDDYEYDKDYYDSEMDDSDENDEDDDNNNNNDDDDDDDDEEDDDDDDDNDEDYEETLRAKNQSKKNEKQANVKLVNVSDIISGKTNGNLSIVKITPQKNTNANSNKKTMSNNTTTTTTTMTTTTSSSSTTILSSPESIEIKTEIELSDDNDGEIETASASVKTPNVTRIILGSKTTDESGDKTTSTIDNLTKIINSVATDYNTPIKLNKNEITIKPALPKIAALSKQKARKSFPNSPHKMTVLPVPALTSFRRIGGDKKDTVSITMLQKTSASTISSVTSTTPTVAPTTLAVVSNTTTTTSTIATVVSTATTSQTSAPTSTQTSTVTVAATAAAVVTPVASTAVPIPSSISVNTKVLNTTTNNMKHLTSGGNVSTLITPSTTNTSDGLFYITTQTPATVAGAVATGGPTTLGSVGLLPPNQPITLAPGVTNQILAVVQPTAGIGGTNFILQTSQSQPTPLTATSSINTTLTTLPVFTTLGVTTATTTMTTGNNTSTIQSQNNTNITNSSNNSTVVNNTSGSNTVQDGLSDQISRTIGELFCRPPPALKPRPPGPLSQHFEEGISSEAGPVTAQINSIAHRLTDYFRGMIIELLQGVDSSAARIRSLERELEEVKHKSNEQAMELRRNIQSILKDIQKGVTEEKAKIIEETRAACELERLREVNEAKSKQWCAFCRKEAQFYCCWNTSYCDYPCQQKHWPAHMSTCSQTRNADKAPTISASKLTKASQPATSKNVLKSTRMIVRHQNKGTPVFVPITRGLQPGQQTITLVEAGPGSYEIVGNNALSMGSKLMPTATLKMKPGSVLSVPASSSTSGSPSSSGPSSTSSQSSSSTGNQKTILLSQKAILHKSSVDKT